MLTGHQFHTDFVQVPVIDLTVKSSSDLGECNSISSVFPTGEQVGQLYAFRVDESNVVLGTRESNESGLCVKIGIQPVANGVYRCVAQNANEEVARNVTIRTICKLPELWGLHVLSLSTSSSY